MSVTQRAIREILQKPGNDACADCGAPGKLEKDVKMFVEDLVVVGTDI